MFNNVPALPQTFIPVFFGDTSLHQYGRNALAVYALSMQLGLDNPRQFASDAITDGGNDKKIDIFYFDANDKYLIVAQNYFSDTWGKQSAGSNKAEDLNTAMGWLLSGNIDALPEHIRPRAIDVRNALQNNEILEIDLLFIHNCFESVPVKEALDNCANVTRDLLKAYNAESTVSVNAKEIGLNRIEELYVSQDREISVDSWIDLPPAEFVVEAGDDWIAVVTTAPGSWIQSLHKEYKERLFSANYRDYLGSRARKGAINQLITSSAENEPANFLVFNNGITALTNELITVHPRTVRFRGISIINGAQTTGALSEAREDSTPNTKVVLRIVQCTDKEIVSKIIQYNNTQNEIKAADRRSNDPVQRRLSEQFRGYGITYVHRRGQENPRNAITVTNIAASLCAFEGYLETAYRHANEIFESSTTYSLVFPERTSAEHVFLVRSLSVAIDNLKLSLKRKDDAQQTVALEADQLKFLKFSASRFFLLYTIGEIREAIMGKRIQERFNWKAKNELISMDNLALVDAWSDVLSGLMPLLVTQLARRGEDAFYEVPRNEAASKETANDLKALITSISDTLEPKFTKIRDNSIT